MKKFEVILLALGFICMGIIPRGYTQTSYKSYYSYMGHYPPRHFTGVEIRVDRNGTGLMIGGELKESLPGDLSYAFAVPIDGTGHALTGRGITSSFPNPVNGILSHSFCEDYSGNIYLAGASVQNLAAPGQNSERTITCLTANGQEKWSVMQPNFAFNSIFFDPYRKALVALSGPYGNSDPSTDLMATQVAPNGKIMASMTFNTPTIDVPVKALMHREGYVFVGTYDTTNTSLPYVIRTNGELIPEWSHAMGVSSGYKHEVKDACVHPLGIIALVGNATPIGSDKSEGFLLLVNEVGDPILYRRYNSGDAGSWELKGIDGFNDMTKKSGGGFVIVGKKTQKGKVMGSDSFILNVDLEGHVIWGHRYSDFASSTLKYLTEGLNDVCIRPGNAYFAAVGARRHLIELGDTLPEIVIIQADIKTGSIQGGEGNCLFPLTVKSGIETAIAYPVGGLGMGGGFLNFSYLTANLAFNTTFCNIGFEQMKVPLPPAMLTIQPKSWVISFTGDQHASGSLELFDVQGRLHASFPVEEGMREVEIQPDRFPNGVYVYRFTQGNGQVYGNKIIWINPNK